MASACSVAIATSEPKLIGTDFLRTPAVGNCVLVTVALICTCVLVVFGVLIVREYSLASGYAETRCRLRNVSFYRDVHCMFCAGLRVKSKDKAAAAAACIPSQFPCVRLMVVFDVPPAGQTIGGSGGGATGFDEPAAEPVQQREAIMHPDSLQATGPYSQCSFSVCLRNKDESQKAVNQYVEDWRSKKYRFTCYYDVTSMDSVIVQKMYSTSDVVHSMLWPSLIVVACGAIFLRLEMRRRRLTICGRRDQSVDGQSGPVSRLAPHGVGPSVTGSTTGVNNRTDDGCHCDKRSFVPAASRDVVGRRLGAAGRAGRPAIVYKSLPSLVIPASGDDVSVVHGSDDQSSMAAAVDDRGSIPLKETLARKLSASMDRFDGGVDCTKS